MDTLFPFCLDVKLPNESKLVPDLAESLLRCYVSRNIKVTSATTC